MCFNNAFTSAFFFCYVTKGKSVVSLTFCTGLHYMSVSSEFQELAVSLYTILVFSIFSKEKACFIV